MKWLGYLKQLLSLWPDLELELYVRLCKWLSLVFLSLLSIAQKNEQWHNAMEAKNLLNMHVISEDDFKKMSPELLLEELERTVADLRPILINKSDKLPAQVIAEEIRSFFK